MKTSSRRQQAEDWAGTQLGWSNWQTEAAAADASFRSYYRIRRGQDSFVIMDAPPEREALEPFIDIARRLERAGLHVPRIQAADPEHGFLLLEDLGLEPYHQVLDAGNADALLGDAMLALQRIQLSADHHGLPVYDAARLRAELALFTDWFLARHWQVEASADELADWDGLCNLLIHSALAQPQVFCHRDFMPRNLMRCQPNPGVIDFQDALLGPISYDPVCLFRDAFLSWPPARVDAWLEQYRSEGLRFGLPLPDSPRCWRRDCDLMGVQRHLKVIGIFARICYRDGKPHYLQDVPRFFDYLALAISRNRDLAELATLIQGWRGRSREAA